MPYNALKDFEPVIWAGSTQNILTVRADSQFKSVKELIDYAKANPNKLNYGSTGSGSSNHLSMELFLELTDTKMTHIPYKGSAPAVRSEGHTSELQSLMRISYAVFCLKKKNNKHNTPPHD